MRIIKTMVLILALCSLYANGTKLEVDPPVILTPVEYIKLYAERYQAPVEQLLKVARCESGFDPASTGDHGKANGIFQYHYPTFIRMSGYMGEKLEYTSTEDQAKLTAWIFKNKPHLKREWTCSYITGII